MSTLVKTTRLQSTDMFPNSVDFTSIEYQQIDGLHSSFQSIDIPANSSITLFESEKSTGDGGVLYLYLQSINTNPDSALEISITNNTNDRTGYFARLFPGDVASLPLYANDENGIKLIVKNLNATLSSSIFYFAGEKN